MARACGSVAGFVRSSIVFAVASMTLPGIPPFLPANTFGLCRIPRLTKGFPNHAHVDHRTGGRSLRHAGTIPAENCKGM